MSAAWRKVRLQQRVGRVLFWFMAGAARQVQTVASNGIRSGHRLDVSNWETDSRPNNGMT